MRDKWYCKASVRTCSCWEKRDCIYPSSSSSSSLATITIIIELTGRKVLHELSQNREEIHAAYDPPHRNNQCWYTTNHLIYHYHHPHHWLSSLSSLSSSSLHLTELLSFHCLQVSRGHNLKITLLLQIMIGDNDPPPPPHHHHYHPLSPTSLRSIYICLNSARRPTCSKTCWNSKIMLKSTFSRISSTPSFSIHYFHHHWPSSFNYILPFAPPSCLRLNARIILASPIVRQTE